MIAFVACLVVLWLDGELDGDEDRDEECDGGDNGKESNDEVCGWARSVRRRLF